MKADTCYCIPIWMIYVDDTWVISVQKHVLVVPRPSFSRDTSGGCSPIPKANSDVKDDIYGHKHFWVPLCAVFPLLILCNAIF